MLEAILDVTSFGTALCDAPDDFAALFDLVGVYEGLEGLALDLRSLVAEEPRPVGRYVGENPVGAQGVDDVVGVLNQPAKSRFALAELPPGLGGAPLSRPPGPSW